MPLCSCCSKSRSPPKSLVSTLEREGAFARTLESPAGEESARVESVAVEVVVRSILEVVRNQRSRKQRGQPSTPAFLLDPRLGSTQRRLASLNSRAMAACSFSSTSLSSLESIHAVLSGPSSLRRRSPSLRRSRPPLFHLLLYSSSFQSQKRFQTQLPELFCSTCTERH